MWTCKCDTCCFSAETCLVCLFVCLFVCLNCFHRSSIPSNRLPESLTSLSFGCIFWKQKPKTKWKQLVLASPLASRNKDFLFIYFLMSPARLSLEVFCKTSAAFFFVETSMKHFFFSLMLRNTKLPSSMDAGGCSKSRLVGFAWRRLSSPWLLLIAGSLEASASSHILYQGILGSKWSAIESKWSQLQESISCRRRLQTGLNTEYYFLYIQRKFGSFQTPFIPLSHLHWSTVGANPLIQKQYILLHHFLLLFSADHWLLPNKPDALQVPLRAGGDSELLLV